MKKQLLLIISGVLLTLGSYAQLASDALPGVLINTTTTTTTINNPQQLSNGICTNPIMACASDTIIIDTVGCSYILNLNGVSGESIIYSDSFTTGNTYCPGSSQYDNWGIFRDSLTGFYNKVTIRGDLDPVGISCSRADIVSQLADALKNEVAISLLCNGIMWSVGTGCTGGCAISGDDWEINAHVTAENCSCGTDYTVRPCIGNTNWGAIIGTSCDGATQTMEVVFEDISPVIVSDTCDIDTVELVSGVAFGDTLPYGTTTNTYEVKDSLGGVSICSYKIHVLSPSVATSCPVNITKTGAQIIDYNIPTSLDSCATSSYGLLTGLETGSIFGEGITPVSYVYLDSLGNLDTCSFTVTINSLNSVEENLNSQFTVYPNPATNVLFIDQMVNENVVINMIDLQGRIIKQKQSANKTISIDLSNIEAGIYFININSSLGEYKTKIIVE